MKKERTKKSKLWLWIIIAIAALAIIGGAIAAFVYPGFLLAGPGQAEQPEAKLYWNLDRHLWLDEEFGLSIRKPAEDGYYHISFLVDGEVKDVLCADKQLVNYADGQELICPVFDADGFLVDAMPVADHFSPAAKAAYVARYNNGTLSVNTSMLMNGLDMSIPVPGNVPICDVAVGSKDFGTKVTPEWLDEVSVYKDLDGNIVAVYITGNMAIDAEIGYRVERMYANGKTTRVPDKNGVYTIEFAINGKIEKRYARDEKIVNLIDAGSAWYADFALIYDDEGYIVEYESPQLALQGKQLAQHYTVDSVTDGAVVATKYMQGYNQGSTVQFTYDETCDIFQCCEGGCWKDHRGERTDHLEPGDLITVYTDLDGKPLLIFVHLRMQDVPMYYLLNPKAIDAETNQTTRKPDENGYYVHEFAVNGKVKQLRTKSLKLSTEMDIKGVAPMGLKVSGTIVKDVYNYHCVSGYSAILSGEFVTSVTEPIITAIIGNNPDNPKNYIMSSDCQTYFVGDEYNIKRGAKVTVQDGDAVKAYRNIRGEINFIYVLSRYQSGHTVGYNVKRMYDSVLKETSRVPDADGYYVFEIAHDGKNEMLKTKNKDLATFIDRQSGQLLGLKIKNGIITSACQPASTVKYGSLANSGHTVDNTKDNILSCWYFTDGEKITSAKANQLTSKTKIYNVSANHEQFKGEKTKLKKNDKIKTIENTMKREVVSVFITSRPISGPAYWLSKAAGAAGPDGYYVFEFVEDGKLVNYRTKDKALRDSINGINLHGLVVDKKTGIISKRFDILDTEHGMGYSWNYDVTKVSGKKIYTQRLRAGTSNYGAVADFEINSKTKIIDVCPYSDNYGKLIKKINVGDRVYAYGNADGVTYVFVRDVASREKGSFAKCSHCNKEVFWSVYINELADNMHIYVPKDMSINGYKLGSATDDKKFTYILDLNGKTLTSDGCPITVNDNLIILDSVGGGKISAGTAGVINGAKQGGNILVNEGASLTLLSGSIVNGNASPSGIGSNIAVINGTVNIKGGTVGDGTGYLGTAIYHSGTKGGVNIVGGKVTGSVFAEETNKITLSGAPVVSNLIVNDGTTVKVDGLKSGASITVKADGVFTSGKAAAYKDYFKPANASDSIAVSGDALKYTNGSGTTVVPQRPSTNSPLNFKEDGKTAMCMVCGKEVEWTPLKNGENIGNMRKDYDKWGNVKNQNLHYYVSEDMTAAEAPFAYLYGGNQVCLHLNGKTLNLPNGICGAGGDPGALNIFGEGTVNHLAHKDNDGSVGKFFMVMYGININLYGGTYNTMGGKELWVSNLYSRLTIAEDAVFNVPIKADNGNVTLSGNASVKLIDIQPAAKVNLAKGYAGTAVLNLTAGLVDNKFPAANASVGEKVSASLLYGDMRPIQIKNGELVVVDGDAPAFNPNSTMNYCKACGTMEVWKPLAADTVLDSSVTHHHVYLPDNITTTQASYLIRTATSHVCLNTNGKTLTLTNGKVWNGKSSKLNVFGGGTIEATKRASAAISAVYGFVNIYDGTYKANGEAPLVNASTGTFRIYGDTNVSKIVLVQGVLELHDKASTPNLDNRGGKVIVQAGWAGEATVKFPAGTVNAETGEIAAANGAATGDFTGTLTLTTGEKLVHYYGGLKMEGTDSDTPTPPPVNNNELKLDPQGKADCPACGAKSVLWTKLNSTTASSINDGVARHYYLADNFDDTSTSKQLLYLSVKAENKVCLHLSGKTLTTGRTITVEAGHMNIIGSGGSIVFNNCNGHNRKGISTTGGTLNIDGGTYTYAPAEGMAENDVISVSRPTILKDAVINGYVSLAPYTTALPTLQGATTVTKGIVFTLNSSTGLSKAKLTVDTGWTGMASATFPTGGVVDGVVSDAYAVANGDFAGVLVNAETGEQLVHQDGKLVVSAIHKNLAFATGTQEAFCAVCNKNVTWNKVGAAQRIGTYNDGGHHHYYLDADLTCSDQVNQVLTLTNNSKMCLHLNGHALTAPSEMFVDAGSTLNILGSGSVLFTGTGPADYIRAALVSAGTANLHSGVLVSEDVNKPVIAVEHAQANVTVGNAAVNGNVKVTLGNLTLDKNALVLNIAVLSDGKLTVNPTFTGVAQVSFASAFVEDAMPNNSVATGAFTGKVFLADGTILVAKNNVLAKQVVVTP